MLANTDVRTWIEVLELPSESGNVLGALTESIDKLQIESGELERCWNHARTGTIIQVQAARSGMPPLIIEMHIRNRAYRAKAELFMLDGSYNLTAGRFLGSVATPSIDTQSAHPGDDWDEVDHLPAERPKKIIAIFMEADWRGLLLRFGEASFPSISEPGDT